MSYGAPPPPRSTFKEMMSTELGASLDLTRVHFFGVIPHEQYPQLLQVPAARVYLTYPFALSWSFLEAMASGCLIVGSATPPVREVLRDGRNGVAVDFFSPQQLAEQLERALTDPPAMQALREAARAVAVAVAGYDLKSVLLPQWLKLCDDLIAGRRPTVPVAVSAPRRSATSKARPVRRDGRGR